MNSKDNWKADDKVNSGGRKPSERRGLLCPIRLHAVWKDLNLRYKLFVIYFTKPILTKQVQINDKQKVTIWGGKENVFDFLTQGISKYLPVLKPLEGRRHRLYAHSTKKIDCSQSIKLKGNTHLLKKKKKHWKLSVSFTWILLLIFNHMRYLMEIENY